MRIKTFLLIFIMIFASLAFAQESPSRNIPQLMERLKDENKEVRRQAANDLINIGKPAVPALLKELEKESVDKGQNETKRRQVIHAITFALGNIKDKSAAPVLFKLLNDKDAKVIIYATEVICTMQDEAMVNELIKLTVKQEFMLYKIMEDSKEGTPKEEIQKQMDPHFLMRISIAAGLLNSADLIRPIIIRGLKNKDWEIRYWAASSLPEFMVGQGPIDQAVIKSLQKLSNDENTHVRGVAETSLKRLGFETKANP